MPDPTTLELGAGMAFRTRPQSVLRRERTSARLVGAVGRASVGFGLAVGRSRSVHPVVRRTDLNSAALRPPTDFWRQRVDDDLAPEPSTAPAQPSATSRGARRPAPIRRARGTVPPTPSAPTPPRRASWTDQILQRSSVGWTERAAMGVNQAPPAPPPDDFVSTGDARLDAMRLAMKAAAEATTTNNVAPAATSTRRDSAPSAVSGDSVQRVADGVPRSDTVSPGEPDVAIDTTPGATAAGRATAPGSFASTLRPEQAEETAASAVAREARTSAPVAARRSPAPRDRLDDLRAALAARAEGERTAPAASEAAAGGSRRAGARPEPAPQRTRTRRSPIDSAVAAPGAPLTGATAQRRAGVADTLRRIREQSAAASPGTAADSGSRDEQKTSTAGDTATGSALPDTSPLEATASGAPPASPAAVDASSGTTGSASDAATRGNDAGGRGASTPAIAPPVASPPSTSQGPASTGVTDAAPGATASPAPAQPSAQRRIDSPSSPAPEPEPNARASTTSPPELPTESGGLTGPAGSTRSGAIGEYTAAGTPVTTAVRPASAGAMLRAQRTLTSDGRAVSARSSLDPHSPQHDVSASGSASAPRSVVDPAGRALTTRAVAAPTPGATASISASATSAPTMARPTLPVSPTARRSPDGEIAAQILRRVTLPRSTSVAHRPPTPAFTRASTMSPTGTTSDDPVSPVERSAPTTGAPTTAAVRPVGVARVAELPIASTPSRGRDTPSPATQTISSEQRATSSPSASSSSHSSDDHLAAGSTGGSARASVQHSNTVRRSPDVPRPPTVRTTTISGSPRTTPPTNGPSVAEAMPEHTRRPNVLASLLQRRVAESSAARVATAVDATTGPQVAALPGAARARTSSTPTPASALPADHGSAPEPAVTPTRPASADAAGASGRLISRFMDELSTTVQRRPDRLPSTYRPMADVITGGRRVMLSTDAASRRALRSVGKVAATTDDVIHLDTAATPRRRMDEVIAHELTHVAHPSATPRFFDDVDHSPEERKAEQVAEIIARSPLAPNAPAATRPAAAPSATGRADTIRRSPAAAAGSSSSVSADSLAATVSASRSPAAGSSSSGSSSAAMLRRAIDHGSTPPPSSPSAGVSAASDQTIRRFAQPSTAAVSESVGTDDQSNPFDSPEAEEWFLGQVDRHFDRLVDRLEARMIVELERRGGRTWGGL